MTIQLHIDAADAHEFKALVQELYASLFPPVDRVKEVVVQHLPPDPKLRAACGNALGPSLRLLEHLKATTKVGEHFSSLAAGLVLGMTVNQRQGALTALKARGAIKLVQKGIWMRVV